MKSFIKIAFCCIILLTLTVWNDVECATTRSRSSSSSSLVQPSHSDRLLPLKRQKKSIQRGLSQILPAIGSPFRERQRQTVLENPTFYKDVKRNVASAFSERRHMLEKAQRNGEPSFNLHRRLFSKKKKDDGMWAYAVSRELEGPDRPRKRESVMTSKWQQPRFAVSGQHGIVYYNDGDNDEKEDMGNDDHINWNDKKWSYGQRRQDTNTLLRHRRRMIKRTSEPKSSHDESSISKKELDNIFADEKENQSLTSTTIKSKENETSPHNDDLVKPTQLHSIDTSKSHSFKGKEWVPPQDDSERTLRSKKSWEDYFGIDKRSVPADSIASGRTNYEDDDDNDDRYNRDDNELRDFLVKWYFDKMLHHVIEHPAFPPPVMPDDENATGDDVKDEDDNDDDDNDDDDDQEQNEDLRAEYFEKKKKKKRDFEESDEVPLKAVDIRLKKIEEMILLKATRLLEQEMNYEEAREQGIIFDDSVNDEEQMIQRENYILEHLKAAYSLEKMRNDLEEFENSLTRLKSIDEEVIEAEDSEIYDADKKKKKKKKSDFQKELSAKTEYFAEENNDDDRRNKKKKKNEGGGIEELARNSVQALRPTAVIHDDKIYVHENEPSLSSACPVVTEAIDYCDDLGQALGASGATLARSCVEYMLCYTCEGLPSLCDSLFLRRATDLCNDDFRCQAMAAAMRSVFLSNHDDFHRRNNPFCIRDQCLAKLATLDK